MDILIKISERLKELMSEEDLKVTEFAEKSGLDASVISRISTAERMPSYATFIAIADYFGCSADFLIGKSEHWSKRTFKPCPPFNKQLDFLLDYYKISKYRLEKGAGLKEETVNRWHKGKYQPTVENLVKIAKYFGCSLDFVLGRES